MSEIIAEREAAQRLAKTVEYYIQIKGEAYPHPDIMIDAWDCLKSALYYYRKVISQGEA